MTFDVTDFANRCRFVDWNRRMAAQQRAARNEKADEKPAVPIRHVCRNKRARFQYEVLEVVEAGLVLMGTEVKSLRDGKCSIDEAFARITDGEIWLCDCEIPPYTHGNRSNHEPKRPRKLLLHRTQIGKLAGSLGEKGYTIVPLSVYFSRGLAKVKIGLARGRKTFDKRQHMKERDAKREIARAMSSRRRDD